MHQANANDFSRDVHIPHCHPAATDIGADEIFRQQCQYGHNAKHQQVFRHRRIKHKAEYLQLLRSNHARGTVVGEPLHFGQRPHHEKLRCQCRRGQIEAAHTQRRQSENNAQRRSAQTTHDKREQQRDARYAQHEIVGGECTDGHESRRAQRQLTRIAGQYVQAERGQRKNQEGDQDRRKQIGRGDQWHDKKCQCKQERDTNAVLTDGKNLPVGFVSGFELSCFTVQHENSLNLSTASFKRFFQNILNIISPTASMQAGGNLFYI